MKKSGFRVYSIVFFISLGISIFSTTLLKLLYTDPDTGFIVSGNVMGTILTIISRLSLILPIVFWFIQTLSRSATHDYALSYTHPPTSILSILTGVTMMVYCFRGVPGQMVNAHTGDFGSKMGLFINIVLGVVGGISMIVGGVRPKYVRHGNPGAALGFFPALWQLVVLLARFNNFIAVTTISDILLNILFMCFASMFLLGQSRIIYGLGARNGRTYAISAGLSAALVGLTFVVSNAIYYIKAGAFMAPMRTMGLAEFIYITVLSLYAVVFVSGYSKSIHSV